MSGFVCPHCGKTSDIFKSGGGEAMAADMDVPFLGRVPLDPAVVQAGDAGELYMETHPRSPTARAFGGLVQAITDMKSPRPPQNG